MKKFASYLVLVLFGVSVASGTTYISGDAIRNPARTQTWTLPATGGTLVKTTDNIATSTLASTLTCTATSTNASFYPLFVSSSSTGSQGAGMDAGLSYNPSTDALTTTTFIGALSGNATTATTATTGTNATNTAITDDTTTNATMYPTWVTAATGNLPQKVSSTKLTFNPSTGALTATSFAGNHAAANLTGTTMASNVVTSSLTALGTITTGVWNGTKVSEVYGGTNQSTYTTGDMLYASASNTLSKIASGTNGQSLMAVAASTAPLWTSPIAPVVQNYTSGTNAAHNLAYAFITTSGTPVLADTYTNNGVTYTVIGGTGTVWYMSGSGAPTTSGTLTRASGTGSSSVVFSIARTPTFLYVLMVGGGGGGGCGGNNGACSPAAGDGTATCFGTNATACTSSLFSAAGGSKGTNGTPGAGGAATITAPALGLGITGETGSGFTADANGVTTYGTGSLGGSSMFGGRGYGNANDVGQAALANSGSGGGGGGYTTAATTRYSGCGGGSGANIQGLVYSPAATYNYTIGSGGAAATTGNTNGFAGGAGAAGRLSIWSYY